MPRAFPSLCLSGVVAPLSLVRSDDGPQRTTIASITTVTTPSPHLRAPPPSTLIAKPWCLRSGSVGLVHDLTPLDCLRGGLRIEGCGQSPFSAAAQCARLQGLMNPGPANLASVKCQKKELLKKVDVDIQIFLGSNYLVRPLLRKGLRPARPQTIQQRLSSFSMREKKTIRSLMRASVEQNGALVWTHGQRKPSPCNWTGVDCSTTGPRGRYQGDRVPVVSNISVSACGSSLNGTLDRLHFADFPHLLHLDLTGNSLSGTIPSSIESLSELVFLDLSYNYLNGSIPPSIGLPHLAYLGLSNNAISGRIPSNIGALAKLEYLDLSFNHLDGSIPPSIGLPHLAYLGLSHNSLSGPDLGWGGPLAPSSTSLPLVAAKVWWQWLETATHNRLVAAWRRALCRARLGLACPCCYVRSTTASLGGGGCSLPHGCAAAVPDLALALSTSRPHVGDL
nr:brassinosteroid LRR receptor kinase BRL2-like [Lolium perenne]